MFMTGMALLNIANLLQIKLSESLVGNMSVKQNGKFVIAIFKSTDVLSVTKMISYDRFIGELAPYKPDVSSMSYKSMR